MKLAVIGCGTVGLASGLNWSRLGHFVDFFDSNSAKIQSLKEQRLEIDEPGLAEWLHDSVRQQRVRFFDSLHSDVETSVLVLCTNSNWQDTLERSLQQFHNLKLIIIRSTLQLGQSRQLHSILNQSHFKLPLIYVPEFLSQGSAAVDQMEPYRIVIGCSEPLTQNVTELLRLLFPLDERPVVWMNFESAELTKLASNSMLATRISFMNEILLLAERSNADIQKISQAMSLDPRIGEHHLKAGLGFGGSCLPKDLQVLISAQEKFGVSSFVSRGVEQTNLHQAPAFQTWVAPILKKHKIKSLGVLGLSFKSGTNDLRCSKGLEILRLLRNFNSEVAGFDPAPSNRSELLQIHPDLNLPLSFKEFLNSIDACVVNLNLAPGAQLDVRTQMFDELKKFNGLLIDPGANLPNHFQSAGHVIQWGSPPNQAPAFTHLGLSEGDLSC